MANGLMEKQAKAQAIYMNKLAQLAKAKAEQHRDKLAFDPQGRVLIDITLSDNEIIAIVTEINSASGTNFPLTKKGLDSALGKEFIPTTPTTIVSLDVSNNELLLAQFNELLNGALNKAGVKKPQEIISKLKDTPKGSIIALQQEFDFHLNLVSRVYAKAVPVLTEEKMKAVHQATMLQVNQLVMNTYAVALKKAVNKSGEIDVAILNNSLDKARKELLPQIHSLMMQQIIQQTGTILSKKMLEEVQIELSDGTEELVSLKQIAAGTTATANDVLHLDQSLDLATLIAGSNHTAHERIQGSQFAHKQLMTHSLSGTGEIAANEQTRLQIRTPSPVLKEGLPNDNAYINDVAEKLKAVKKEYNLGVVLTGEHKPKKFTKAFIYNSYTAINDGPDDFLGTIGFNENLQSKSAEHILRGMHRYNVRQLRDTTQEPVFCFVQNISVNGFGDSLKYDTGNALREESTLMSEMALLHTLYSKALSVEQEKIDQIFQKYSAYLEHSPNRESYFSSSVEGHETKKSIQELKEAWKFQVPAKEETLLDNVQLSLKNLMAHDLHFNHKYAKLVQVLSVYAEEASIGGCKSGNERAQAINGRVAILDSLANGKESEGMVLIRQVLTDLAKGGKDVPHAAKRLKVALDNEYNKVGLQNAASIISLVDQGASAKVEAKEGAVGTFTSRNYAEEQKSVMTNLHQEKAGAMQAHKSLTKMMMAAWEGFPLTFWERMNSSPLKQAGGLLGALLFVITLPYHLYDNWQRQIKALEANISLKAQTYDKEHPNVIEHEIEDSSEKIQQALSNIPSKQSDKKSSLSDKEPKQTKSVVSSLLLSMQTTKPTIQHPGVASTHGHSSFHTNEERTETSVKKKQ